jgi:hypothetical protein
VKKVDPPVTAELWNRFRSEPLTMITMFINNGVRPERGKTKKESLIEVLGEVAKAAYVAGLQQGYDLGHAVFSPRDAQAPTEVDASGSEAATDVCGEGRAPANEL